MIRFEFQLIEIFITRISIDTKEFYLSSKALYTFGKS